MSIIRCQIAWRTYQRGVQTRAFHSHLICSASAPAPPSDSSSTAQSNPETYQIRYKDPRAATHIIETNPDIRRAFANTIASKADLARAWRDFEDYSKTQGYIDASDPSKEVNEETRLRMQRDPIVLEKSLVVRKLMILHGILREDSHGPQPPSAPDGRRVQLVRGAVPGSHPGMPPAGPPELSRPLQWFKKTFMKR